LWEFLRGGPLDPLKNLDIVTRDLEDVAFMSIITAAGYKKVALVTDPNKN
jgi:hypothetical protein